MQRAIGTPPVTRLVREIPVTAGAVATVKLAREGIRRVIERSDSRKLVIVGPCSIHDTYAALEYASRLRSLSRDVEDVFAVVMRVYFEKPRTSTGWRGFIADPDMDGSFRLEHGLAEARRLLIAVNETGVPCATEILSPFVAPLLQDLVAWAAVGARTIESQTHRELASTMPCAVGFKNGTDGSVQGALNAIRAAREPNTFLGIDGTGALGVIRSGGALSAHLVLRGGPTPNYSPEHVQRAEAALRAARLPEAICIDCSHGNSGKDPARQQLVLESFLEQIDTGSASLAGVMIESHLEGGAQVVRPGGRIDPRISVTDPCLGWEDTRQLLLRAAERLRRLENRRCAVGA